MEILNIVTMAIRQQDCYVVDAAYDGVAKESAGGSRGTPAEESQKAGSPAKGTYSEN